MTDMSVEITPIAKPINTETRVPTTVCAKMSCPVWVVPSQWAGEGGERISGLNAFGSCVTNSGPKIATSTQNRKVSLGFYIVLFFVLVAIFGPLFVTQDPNAFSPDILSPPSPAHWLGTTQTGQDIFAQTVVGTRVSVFIGFAIGVISTLISVIFGLAGGYYMGWIDEVLSLFTNIFLVLPTVPLAIVLAAF